ncbi:DUF3987 domain-containing protein [Joostella atrarenae]|uniref:DUF3987 domain-containing protein n=1 Tax=Joostella atrarenae TaxID=679257 RepID=A0ABS9J7G9_9FLAO|nr:DUF3987 domain-containing protein [Joostella atrarenae]MCF8716364.1 DUF3987 domain-containing protein [Joostella atrarenae]
MEVNKKQASYTLGSIKGSNNDYQSKNRKNDYTIDIIDLENDYLKFAKRNKNPFPIDIFPKEIQEIIFEAFNKYQFTIDYLGAGVLSAASAAIGVTHKVLVKKGWEEKANLYTVIVGRPGDSKSHALNFCFKPIHIKEDHFFMEYENNLNEYEKNCLESPDNKIKLKKPILKKILISDFTPEALMLTHANNKRGLYIYVDELHGWIKNFNRYNSSGEAETYLSLWSGAKISTDRASGKSLRISDPYIGVIGGTQIDVLKEFAKEGRGSNGFMDRLLFVYPEEQKTLKWNINKVDEVYIQNYFSIISNLIDLDINEDNNPVLIPIKENAKKYLFNWQNDRPDNYLFDFERSADIKLQQYVIRFALILQLLKFSVGTKSKEMIDIDSIKGAIKLFDYFYHNAMKVRNETIRVNYIETLTELQKTIFNDLPYQFKTNEGLKIACKIINGRPRISDRQFKTFLNDKKLFKRISHGNYKKLL